jgi:hypothetical protein
MNGCPYKMIPRMYCYSTPSHLFTPTRKLFGREINIVEAANDIISANATNHQRFTHCRDVIWQSVAYDSLNNGEKEEGRSIVVTTSMG